VRIPNQYYLIIDLEATCTDDDSFPRDEMEIIEIGAVLQNARTFEIESEFETFVRPVRHPVLTRFCLELTGIAQTDLAGAPSFPDALEALKAWMRPFDDTLFCSWGNYDRNQFEQDCDFHQVPYPFGPRHTNLKAEFTQSRNLPKAAGISKALKRLGFRFEGSPHRGLDDARNVARIVRRVCVGA
jgi:inhibitor of KinA sporulation pathway (predicted exonuclease)